MPKRSESHLAKLQKRCYNQSKGQCQTLTATDKETLKRRESNLEKLQKKIL